MKRTIKIFAITAAAVLLSSCDLDLFPTNAIAYQEGAQMITTKDELTAYEKGILASFRGSLYGEFSMTEDIQCDAFNATVGFGNNWGGVHRGDNSFTSSDYYVRDFWGVNYIAIKNYNILLAAIDNVPEDIAADAKIVKGEACFFRAFSYLNLVRHFAKDYDPATAETELGVPVVLVYNQNEKPSRNTVKETYDAIKKDLDSAAVLLAGVAGKVRAAKPTIDAVNALYARYYLDIHEYANAVTAANSVITSAAGYTLSNSAAAMVDEFSKDSGKEPILQLFASKTELPNSNSEYMLAASSKTYPVYLRPYYIPSGKLISLYEATDLRLAQWFDNTTPVEMNGSYFNDGTPNFYTFVKYYGNPDLQGSAVPNSCQAIKPLTIAEQYLIKAEAAQASGGDAATPLNALQVARGATATAATAAKIQDEWFKETVGEGLRLSCIKRWGTGYTARTGQAGAVAASILTVTPSAADYTGKAVSADDFHLVWPMPSSECQVNPNLAAQQNPGWSDVDEAKDGE